MYVNYVPAACKGETPQFKGSVVLRVPSIIERYDYLSMANLDVSGSELDVSSVNKFDYVKKLIAASEKHYQKVELIKLSDGTEYKTYQDLIHDPECDSIVIEIASNLPNGYKLGK